MVSFRYSLAIVDNFSRALGNFQSLTARITDTSRQLTPALRGLDRAFFSVAAAADVGLVGASIAAARFEDRMARLATVTISSTQSVERSLNNASKAAIEFSDSFTASAGEIITAQFELATAGVPVEEQVAAVQASFKLAQATVGDFVQTARLLGQFLNTFGQSAQFNYLEPTEKMQRITDILSTTVQRFQVTLPVLAEGFKFIVGPANQLGLSLSEVSVALGILNTAGFRGTLAGTALSNTFNKLDRAIEKLDLDPSKFTDLEGNLSSLADFLEQVRDALADTSPIEAQLKLIDIFDIRSGRVIKTLLNSVDAIRKYTVEFDIARGATERMANTLQTTTGAEFKKLINSLENVFITIGTGINSAVRPFLRILGDLVSRLREFVNNLGPIASGLLAIGAIIISLSAAVRVVSVALAAMGVQLPSLVKLFKAPFIGAKTAITSVTTALTNLSLVATLTTGELILLGSLIAAPFIIASLALSNFEDSIRTGALQSIAEFERTTLNGIETANKLTGEYKLLGEAASIVGAEVGNINVALGDSAFAKEAQRLRTSIPGINSQEAIKKAFESGVVEQDIKSLADALKLPAEQVQKLIDNIIKFRTNADLAFSQKHAILQTADAIEGITSAATLAQAEVLGVSKEVNEGFSKISTSINRVEELETKIKELDRTATSFGDILNIKEQNNALEQYKRNIVETVVKTGRELISKLNLPAELGKQLVVAGHEVERGVKSMDTVFQEVRGSIDPIVDSVTKLQQEANKRIEFQFAEEINQSNKNLERLREGFNRTERTVNALKEGIIDLPEATERFERANKGIEEAFRSQLILIERLQEKLSVPGQPEQRLEEGRKLLQDIKDTIEKDRGNTIQFQAEFDEVKLLQSVTGLGSKALQKFKEFNFGNEIGRIFVEQFTNVDAKIPASTRLKQSLATELVSNIGQTVQNQIKAQLFEKLNINKVILDAFTADKDLGSKLFQGGIDTLDQLVQKIPALGDELRALKIDPNQFNVFGQFNSQIEQAASSLADLQVAFLKSDATSQVFLNQLADIVTAGPVGALSLGQLKSQIQELATLVSDPRLQGTAASAPAERFLKERLERENQLRGAATGIKSPLAQEGLDFESNVRRAAEVLRPVVVDLKEAARDINLARDISISRSLAVEVTSQDNRILNVNITRIGDVTGQIADNLSENEVRQIVRDFSDQRERDLREEIRQLEGRLRTQTFR